MSSSRSRDPVVAAGGAAFSRPPDVPREEWTEFVLPRLERARLRTVQSGYGGIVGASQGQLWDRFLLTLSAEATGSLRFPAAGIVDVPLAGHAGNADGEVLIALLRLRTTPSTLYAAAQCIARCGQTVHDGLSDIELEIFESMAEYGTRVVCLSIDGHGIEEVEMGLPTPDPDLG